MRAKFRLFDINYWYMPINKILPCIGHSFDGYRIIGYTDLETWVECVNLDHPEGKVPYYDKFPCDHTGNRKYAIGLLEEECS